MDFDTTNLAILIGSLFPNLLLFVGVWLSYRRKKMLHVILLATTFLHEAMLFMYPLWYDTFSGFGLENEMAVLVTPQLLAKTVLMENLYVTLFMLPLYFSVLSRRKAQKAPVRNQTSADKYFLQLLLCAGLVIYLVTFLRPEEDYESVIQHAEIHANLGYFNMIYGWFHGLFALPALIVGCLYVSKRDAQWGWRLIGGAIVILVVAYGLAAGLRGRLTWVISLLVVGAILYKQRRMLVIAVIGAISLLPIAQYLGGGWSSVTLNDLGGGSQMAALERLYQVIKEGDAHSDENGTFAQMVARRAQGPRNSTLLFLWYDDGHGCGLQPLVSSLVAIVPRAIWPNKGVGGSSDLTPYGAATFLVRRIGYNAPIYNMGPILASAHAYWEGGYTWVVIGGFITGLMWVVILRLAGTRSLEIGALYVLLFAGSLLIDGLFTALFPIYSYVLMFYNTILGLLLLQWFIKKLCVTKKTPILEVK